MRRLEFIAVCSMKRRMFVAMVGGAAMWPRFRRAQQPERMRRTGLLALI